MGFTRAKVVNTQRNTYKRKIAESLCIKNHSTVEGNKSSFPLCIFKANIQSEQMIVFFNHSYEEIIHRNKNHSSYKKLVLTSFVSA